MLRRQSVTRLWLCFLRPTVIRAIIAVCVIRIITRSTCMYTIVHAEPSDIIEACIHVIVVVCVKPRCGLRS